LDRGGRGRKKGDNWSGLDIRLLVISDQGGNEGKGWRRGEFQTRILRMRG
jgi:hypothetical protein